MKTLVTVGRGGTGKTSFVAVMARYFIQRHDVPILLVDADPDQNLAEMVGVDLEKAGIGTISDLVTDTFIRKGGTTIGIPPSERIESRIWKEGLYEGESFDLIAVGTKWIEGCYCMPDAALKEALSRMTRNYRYILIDSPAGVEHLNRKIVSRVDDIFDIVGASSKSFEHVKRAYRIAREVGILFDHFYVVGGNQIPRDFSIPEPEVPQQQYLGPIAYDPEVQEAVLRGKSLLELPEDSPMIRSVSDLMKKAGYG
jgi:CO dehydrogenase maturation factor